MITKTQKGVKQNVKSMVKVEFSEYKRIGTEFRRFRLQVINTYVDLCSVFGVTKLKDLRGLIDPIEHTMSKLDNCVFADYSYMDEMDISGCFYGRFGEPELELKKSGLPKKWHSKLTSNEYEVINDEIISLEKAASELCSEVQKLNKDKAIMEFVDSLGAVSYTHLTLPTNR